MSDNNNQPEITRFELRELLIKRFSMIELRDLCFDLGIDVETLPHDTKNNLTIALLSELERKHSLLKLLEDNRVRPEIQVLRAIKRAEVLQSQLDRFELEKSEYFAKVLKRIEQAEKDAKWEIVRVLGEVLLDLEPNSDVARQKITNAEFQHKQLQETQAIEAARQIELDKLQQENLEKKKSEHLNKLLERFEQAEKEANWTQVTGIGGSILKIKPDYESIRQRIANAAIQRKQIKQIQVNEAVEQTTLSFDESLLGQKEVQESSQTLIESLPEEKTVNKDVKQSLKITLHGTAIGHTGSVLSLAFSPNEYLLVSGSTDQTVRVWDLFTIPYKVLEKHKDNVNAVTFSSDSSLLVSSSNDGSAYLWQFRNEKLLNKFYHPSYDPDVPNPVFYASFAMNDTILISCSREQLYTWRVSDGKNLHSFEPESGSYYSKRKISNLIISPSGLWLAVGKTDFSYFTENGWIELWQMETEELVERLEGHTNTVNCFAFSPNNTLLASGSDDKTIRLWEVPSGKEVAVLRGHSRPVKSIAFSPDGNLLATASQDKTIRIWRVSNGENLCQLTGHLGTVNCLAFSPDGTFLASGSDDETIKIWLLEYSEE